MSEWLNFFFFSNGAALILAFELVIVIDQVPKIRFLGTQSTMCDFHNFGLIDAGQMHCLPQRLKSTLFEIFSNGGCPKGTRSVEKISNNVDFSL